MTTKKPKAAAPAPRSPSNQLRMEGDPAKSRARMLAELAVMGTAANGQLLTMYGKPTFGELDLTDAIDVLHESARAVHGGDLKAAETILVAQAATLNAMFCELARRSSLNMGEYGRMASPV